MSMFSYVGSVNHWVCVASGDCKEINLMDSLNLKITRSLFLRIASVFKSDEKAESKLYIDCLPVQQQNDALDCDLFAIAFAVEICRGKNPREVAGKMGDHLLTCLEMRRFELFPKKRYRSKQRVPLSASKVYSIYRFCHYPETYDIPPRYRTVVFIVY